ncbi:lytic murein transglycosylase [Frankia sp. CN7]|uniref:lytic transglycosylase domain-containing protein n=1 Tax=Frankia nepalensis TaxID=1836974 RepID=UPI0019339CF7|nr:lytic murein transglycosylase [Frankia nepalensis]MBL7495116.1 lytic murein transglycosylase [Frankia nepalensis]
MSGQHPPTPGNARPTDTDSTDKPASATAPDSHRQAPPVDPAPHGTRRKTRSRIRVIGLAHAIGLPLLGIPAIILLLTSGPELSYETGTAARTPTTAPTDGGYPLPSNYTSHTAPASGDDTGTGQASADTLATAAAAPTGSSGLIRLTAAERQIPARVLTAYQQAATTLETEQPGCHLRWQLLAAIGKIESGHGAGRTLTTDGTITPTILGPRLDGQGDTARILDTDHGRLDQDTTYDRAVGPMQFIPSTWTGAGRDGNHDGRKNPNTIDDATLAAGGYLCAHGRDLTNPRHLYAAIRAYNPSDAYVRAVLAWTNGYTTSTTATSPDPDPAPTNSHL